MRRHLVLGALALPIAVSLALLNAEAFATVDQRSPQDQLEAVLALQPGGVQVSDNAVVWGDGDVVYVVPDRGSSVAPNGLGSNVRSDKVKTPALKALARLASSEDSSRPSRTASVAAGTSSCPHGVGVKDYYCFYQYRNYGGRRVQFTGATAAGFAANYGFDNGTSSWVSWDVDCGVDTYAGASSSSSFLWHQPENSSSSYVGSGDDNRMSFWTCD